MDSVYIKVSVDDFHKIGELNTKRIKAYNDVAKDYNIDIGTVRDIFSLGINFAIANMQEIQLPTEKDIEQKEVITYGVRKEALPYESLFMKGANFILNHIKKGG